MRSCDEQRKSMFFGYPHRHKWRDATVICFSSAFVFGIGLCYKQVALPGLLEKDVEPFVSPNHWRIIRAPDLPNPSRQRSRR